MKVSQQKKIVFINQATGYLTIDIINAFANSNKFDDIAVISGIIREQDVPLHESVKWSKINLYDRRSAWRKFSTWLIATIRIFYLLLTKYRKYEIFYITIPPFAYLLSLLLPNKFSVLVFDVYPDVLEIYGIKKTNFIYKSWINWNKKLFAKAHRVYTICEGMQKLITQYIPAKKIYIIPNWSGLTNLKNIPRDQNIFIKEHNLINKFVVQYSGNIGYTHNIEVLIDVAKLLKNEPDIEFIIIGRGEKFQKLTDSINSEKISNCIIMPFQPDSLLNHSLSAANLGVIFLDEKIAHVSIPSKIYNLQSVGVPLLCIASLDSEINNHVQKYNNGKCFNQNGISEIAAWIKEMRNNSEILEILASNSRKASLGFTMKNAEQYVTYYFKNEF